MPRDAGNGLPAWLPGSGRVGSTKNCEADRLVWLESHDDPEAAFRREKRWRRDWKIELIEKTNPTWRDVFKGILRVPGASPGDGLFTLHIPDASRLRADVAAQT